jgi:hypothetical protein
MAANAGRTKADAQPDYHNDATQAAITIRSSLFSFETTGFISCVHSPFREPTCVS